MKNLCLSTMILTTMFISCSDDSQDDMQPVDQNSQNTFKQYQALDLAMDDFNAISSKAAKDLENANKNINQDCIELDLLLSTADNPILGFDDYDHYGRLIIDDSKGQCDNPDWDGRLEFYISGILTKRVKDSTSYKNVAYKNGYSFNGFRVSMQNPDLSTAKVQVYDVIIRGLITQPDGDVLEYNSSRIFTFENRYTKEETIGLQKNSFIINTENGNTINTETAVDTPLLFDASCFNGLQFLRYPVSGSLDLSSSFGIDFNINYGDGACDKKAILTPVGGDPVEINL